MTLPNKVCFLPVVLLATGMVYGQVSFPVQCSVQTAAPPFVRAEGLSELVTDLVFTCRGGVSTPIGQPVPNMNLQVFFNANFTSRLLAGTWSDALLMMEEPGSAGNPVQLVCPASTGICGTTGTGTGVGVYDGASGRSNIFQGQLGVANAVVFLSVPFDPPGATGVRTMRITNARVNANQFGLFPFPSFFTILAFVTATSPVNISFLNPQSTVAFATNGLDFSVNAPRTFSRCTSENPSLAANASANGTSQFSLVFRETFPTSFKKRTTAPYLDANTSPTPVAQNMPGAIYDSETNFFNPLFPLISTRGDLARAGLADQGTRFLARFTGVPPNVKLFSAIVSNLTPSPGVLRMVDADSAGAGPFVPSSANGFGIAPIPVDGLGTATVVYEVLASGPLDVQQVSVPIYVAYDSPLPGSGTAVVAGDFAPVSTVNVASLDAPVPRFLGLTPVPAFTIDTCVPPPQTGRMTGGGSVFTAGGERVTHGFELHCNKASLPNNLEVNWGKGDQFHLEQLTSAVCSDNPAIVPNPPSAGFDTYVGTGAGRLNGVSGATAQWNFTDAGEPGNKDTAAIVIKNSAGAVVLTVSGKLDKGNQQAHKN